MASPIIPWIGGKRRMARRILPLFPDHTCYVEPFCGAAALFFMKAPAKAEVLNDINGELVNLYRVVQHHLDEFVRQFRWALTSREMFKWLRETPTQVLTDIQRAARFFYLQKNAFGGRVASQTLGVSTTGPARLNLLRIEEDLSAAHLRLAGVYVEQLEWSECIRRYDRPNTLFYCDPPYWGTGGYGVEFPLNQYDRLAELARSIKGKMIISVNDTPEMRKAFASLPFDVFGINYTIGQTRKRAGELVIRNF